SARARLGDVPYLPGPGRSTTPSTFHVRIVDHPRGGAIPRPPFPPGAGWATSRSTFLVRIVDQPRGGALPGPRSVPGQVGRRPVPLSWYVSSINLAVGGLGPREAWHGLEAWRGREAGPVGRPGTVGRPGPVGRPALSGRRGTDRAVREGSPPWPFPATSPPHHLALHSGTRAAPSLPGAAYGHGHGTETGGSGARGGVSAAVAARERDASPAPVLARDDPGAPDLLHPQRAPGRPAPGGARCAGTARRPVGGLGCDGGGTVRDASAGPNDASRRRSHPPRGRAGERASPHRAARRASSSPVRDARTARGDDGRAAHRPAADRRPTHSPGARRRRRLAGRGPLRDCAADPAPRGAAAGGARTRPWGSSSPRSRGASPGAGVVATGDPYAPHAEGPRLAAAGAQPRDRRPRHGDRLLRRSRVPAAAHRHRVRRQRPRDRPGPRHA